MHWRSLLARQIMSSCMALRLPCVHVISATTAHTEARHLCASPPHSIRQKYADLHAVFRLGWMGDSQPDGQPGRLVSNKAIALSDNCRVNLLSPARLDEETASMLAHPGSSWLAGLLFSVFPARLDEETASLMANLGAYLVPTTITYAALQREGVAAGMPQELVDKVGEAVKQVWMLLLLLVVVL